MNQIGHALTIGRLAEILAQLSKDGLRWADNSYDRARYQTIWELAERLGGEPISDLGLESGPITPKLGVDGLVFGPDRAILLIRRKDSGLWALPGGAAEIGESPSQAAIREVHEETGIVMKPTHVAGVFDNWAEPDHSAVHLYHIVIAGEMISGDLAPQPEEILEVAFFPQTQLPPPAAFHRGHFRHLSMVLAEGPGRFD